MGKLFTHIVPLFTKQCKLVPAIGWEGNRRSGVALAMCHRLGGIPTCGLSGLHLYLFSVIVEGVELDVILFYSVVIMRSVTVDCNGYE